MKAKIITDSMSDITPDVAEMYDIDVIPIKVSINGSYLPANELDIAETVSWIEENKKVPDFKGINTEIFAKVFEKYINEGKEIVYMASASSIISNFDCASFASTRFPNANIHVIDTHHSSGSTAMIAINAAIMANNGESANAIAIRFERTLPNYRHYGFADTVEFLKYAGRCPRFVAVGANFANAKFGISIAEDHKFDVQMLGTNVKRALSNYVSNVFRDLNAIDPNVVFMMRTISDEDHFTEVYKRVEALDYFDEIVVCDASHYTTSLVGRNGISVAYQLKY